MNQNLYLNLEKLAITVKRLVKMSPIKQPQWFKPVGSQVPKLSLQNTLTRQKVQRLIAG